MGSNSFGTVFRFTTWGESHGKEIGVVVDGCPPGLLVSTQRIQEALNLRKPGASAHTSPRKEADCVEIVSGLFDGVTTGAPIAMRIKNRDVDSSSYERAKRVLRPGHANFTWLEKYGIFDYRGGGRASARETAARVAAGAVADALLECEGISVSAELVQVGDAQGEAMFDEIEKAMVDGDSIGGVVQVRCLGVPAGLGDPVYEKLEAKLASAMMSIPATRGVEFGMGFESVRMRGSEHNDTFIKSDRIRPVTNMAGGIQGGISTGEEVIVRVAFKPASSIRKAQMSVDVNGEEVECAMGRGGRHDPCVAVRGAPVTRAMAQVVLADCLLMQKSVCNISTGIVSHEL